jgi:N-acetylneuraminic acid mutarotase
MKTKIISAYILRGSTAALLFSCVIVALCSAINLPEQPPRALPPQDNAAFGANAHQSAVSVPGSATFNNRSLSFADRVAYQRAIEDIYWRHRIWPKERPEPKPSLDAVMSQAQLEKKVEEYLRNSQALEDYWQRPITAGQLQAEMDRMAQHSKQPEVLHEIFEALGNDPFVIAECLARPVLTQRFANGDPVAAAPNAFGAAHPAKAETQVPVTMAAVSANYTLPAIVGPSGSCIDDTWTPTTLTNPPAARSGHTAVWTGSEMIVWGGRFNGGGWEFFLNTGGRYNPSTDSWIATSINAAPSGRVAHEAVWTGSEMIVWGGYFDDVGGRHYLNTGGRYNPITNSWTATSTTNVPSARYIHTAVWTGNEMIVWGGRVGLYFNTGGRYNPSTDSWTATTTNNAPAARVGHTAVWTGNEMIIWGGIGCEGSCVLNTGGRYNPSTDSWTATTTNNAPAARDYHTAVWTDTEMIVWGGADFNANDWNTGGRYNPSTDSWMATSINAAPSGRLVHEAVWTGSEMIIWGGFVDGEADNTGGRYDPVTNSWTATSITNAPSARIGPTAVWSGSEMIVWGGCTSTGIHFCDTSLNTGGRYCAQSGSPTITLSAAGRKVGGINTVRLTWDGSTSTHIDVYRNNVLIATTPNDEQYDDSTGDTGRARYTYRVCEAGTETCSNDAEVVFRH